MEYQLPCAPAYKCGDRFGVCPDLAEDDNGDVPFWPVLEALLRRPVSSGAALVDILETVAYTLRNECIADFGLLLKHIDALPAFWTVVWPAIVDIALQLPALFPSGMLPVFAGTETSVLELWRLQTACLVVHQFLCTPTSPDWRDDAIDFRIWYSADQRHPTAVDCYLDALFRYFQQLAGSPVNLDKCIQFELRVGRPPTNLSCALSPISVRLVDRHDTSPASLGLPDGACVISANKAIGFGQSATQEEVHVGVSPEACPAVLFTPLLLDNHVLVVTGAQALLNIHGTRRSIEKEAMPDVVDWRHRTMLFMDALELDMSTDDGLADLVPDNIEREIRKAALAFAPSPSQRPYHGIYTGLWGCGAFCADPGVKMLCLWCASSIASQPLTVVCDAEQHVFAQQLVRFIDAARPAQTVADLRRLLAAAPHSLKRHETMAWFLEQC